MEDKEITKELTRDELMFCDLLINGSYPYGGNIEQCYSSVFGVNDDAAVFQAKALLSKTHIKSYIAKLEAMNMEESKYLKKRLTENLLKIADETATSEYRDRNGTLLSPAALRSVSVQASKALMDMYPIREASVSKLDIGDSKGGIVFNVIVPGQSQIKESTEKE